MVVNNRRPLLVALLAALLTTACGSGGGSSVASNTDLETQTLDSSDELFDPERLLRVEITMDPADYEILRYEGRSLPQVFSGCHAGYEYTHFEARVVVDGKSYDRVDVRKKGFLGSLSASRPSFKLNFETHKPDRDIYSMGKLTLNNNNQDPGNTHQCLTYDMFRKAGISAPRCNFARVSVNGDDLGIYTNVESIEERFLSRNFARSSGNLYEAQVGGDFGVYLKDQFQLKTNEDENDRSDLDRVVEALEAEDDSMPGMLDQLVDLDEFLTYWAVEGIAGHWDSASGNANNHFLYHDPTDDRFRYIPWGADGAFELFNPLGPGTGPLYRYITIPARLYLIPEWRDKYYQRVLHLLDTVWDSAALNAEVDRIRDLTETDESKLEQVRNFIEQQPQRVRDSVSGELEQEERTIVDEPLVCNEGEITNIAGSFNQGLASYEYTDAEGNIVSVTGFASPPSDGGLIPIGSGISISIFGQSVQGTRILLLSIDEAEFAPGEIPLHGISTTIFVLGELPDGGFGMIGMAGEGSITLEEPVELEQPATGSFSADFWLDDGSGFGPLGGGP